MRPVKIVNLDIQNRMIEKHFKKVYLYKRKDNNFFIRKSDNLSNQDEIITNTYQIYHFFKNNIHEYDYAINEEDENLVILENYFSMKFTPAIEYAFRQGRDIGFVRVIRQTTQAFKKMTWWHRIFYKG